jgi:pilus assembly protein CpaC
MKAIRTNNRYRQKLATCSVFLLLFLHVCVSALFAASNDQLVRIGIRQSELVEFPEPVKRISIAAPEVADATVTTPTQVLVNGKSLGVTSMIVWNESERYTSYRLVVHSESSSHQVMLRVRFAEINRTALQELGANFLIKNQKIGSETISIGSFAGQVNTPSDPLSIGDNVDFFLSIPTQNITAIFRALEAKNLLTTLAKPNLSAINGTEASFLAGGEIPIPIVSGLGQVTVQYKEFGIRLKFVPTVLDSELVNIKVTTEASSLDFDNGIMLSGFRIPALITRKTETAVELKDGEHFVIGGLIMNEMAKTVSRIPLLGQIPILGKLFSSSRYQNNESELIMMITPHIAQSLKAESVPEIHH